jgi:hypothetical protein
MKERIYSAAFWVSVGLILAAEPLVMFAHHSFAAEYDGDKPITLKGKLTKIEWTNPHSWIYVDVPSSDGKMVSWGVEFGSPNALLRRGLRRSDFPNGLEVTVKGFLAKNGSQTVNASMVMLPDGRSLFTGSSNPNAEGAEK